MLVYLLKFSACLAIFLVFYKLFLERENMHKIKRYYLLAAIFIALSIPLITFTTYVEPVVSEVVEFQTFQITEAEPEIITTRPNYLPIILWTIYSLGVLLFAAKFILNLSKIVIKINRNPKQKTKDFTHVLLRDLVTPHTFFNFIFLNKQKFETQEIPKEVFIHEEAHARQKHSIDILLIELLQIVFWFNPLIYLTKESIKMNHEFLADEAVLKQGISPSIYQQLLLTFSSNVTEPQLANAINYSSIKKRFTVMKTQTSKQKIWLRSFLLLPLVALTLYGFSETKVVERPSIQNDSIPQNTEEKNHSTPEKDTFYKNTIIEFVDKNKNVLESKRYSELSAEQKLQLRNPPTKPVKKQPSQQELDTWKDGKIYGVWVDNKRIKNDNLQNFKSSDFSLYYVSKLEKNAVNYGKHYYQVTLYSNNEYEKMYQNGVQPLGDGAILRIISNVEDNSYPVLDITFNPDVFKLNGRETSLSQLKEDFAKATNSKQSDLRIKTVGGINMSLITQIMDELKDDLLKIRLDEAAYIIADSTQQKATAEEVAEYNKLAKHCNSQIETKSFIVKQKDVNRLQQLYAKMSDDQKKNAEPYPDLSKFPPPPPPPPAPPVPVTKGQSEAKTGFLNVTGEKIFYVENGKNKTYYNRWGNVVDKNGKKLNGNVQVNASDVLPGQYITKVYQNDKVVVEFKNNKPEMASKNLNIPPPPPPPPKSPLDHVIDMAKKGATFYFEGKSISSDDAIKLLKENKDLNISSKEVNSKQPKVYIQKDPISIND